MSEQEELTLFALAEFRPLVDDIGLNEPVVVKENWITRIDYLGENLGLEVALDWRDFAVFVFFVRLEKGALPQGYLVSDGKKCRKYLQEVLQERDRSSRKPKPKQAKTKQALESQITELKELLMSKVKELMLLNQDDLFS